MIVDKLENIELYSGLGERIYKALVFLKIHNFAEMKNGRYEIDGKNIYATISRYQTKPMESGKWESHRKYIDVQFVAVGKERIGYSNLSEMTVKQEYNEEKDVQFLEGTGDFITAEKSTFVILFPQDVHMPGISAENNKKDDVIKVVVKVKVD
ncbi:MAG: YhcH/YjgK/YiaL family protein [Bacteroidetes bacterium]|nr:YhcH/YjgK/YiaL family protein [Bacteroidota bacterium]